jgi:hypothetical protein
MKKAALIAAVILSVAATSAYSQEWGASRGGFGYSRIDTTKVKTFPGRSVAILILGTAY